MSQAELNAILELSASFDDGSEKSLEERRKQMDELSAIVPLPDGTAVETVDAGGRPAFWVTTPASRPDRVILYLHGGGYLLGSPTSHRALTAQLAEASGASIVSLDYRLAPEHPYPAAVEDAVAAYRWLIEDKAIAPAQIAIAGDSAGGGLAIAALMLLRDREMDRPGAAMVISPWGDLTCAAKSMESRAAIDPWITQAGLAEMAAAYLGGADPETHLASPVFGSMEGMPPLLIQVGTREVLYDDSLRLAGAAARAHADVTLEVWEGMPHVWHAYAFMLEEGREAITRMGAFYAAQCAGG